MFLMKQKINWQLFDNNKEIISKKNVEAYYEYNKIFIYEEATEKNVYDYKKNTYSRKTNEYEMVIDFSDKTCSFDFGSEGSCTIDIECKSHVKFDEIILEYKIDDSIKKLVVQINEVEM